MSLERSLAEIVSHRMQVGEPLPVAVALAILRQVCDNLEYAHTMTDGSGQPLWISHRDISPVHILVADTGVARLVASSSPHGNPAYFAPEFVSTAVYDQRSDLFSLGVVAWEMLANRPLFHSPDPRETFAMIAGLSIPPPSTFNPHVPPDLDNIILMTVGRDPAYRWQSAAMLREGLRSVAERFGLQVGANDWVDLLAGRVVKLPPPPPPPVHEPPMVRPPPSPVLLAPPDDPPPPAIPGASEWADDDNNATTLSPSLPKDYVPVAAQPTVIAPPAPSAKTPPPTMIVSPAPAPPPVDDIVTFKPSPKPAAALADAAAAPRRPIQRTPSEADFLATLEPEGPGEPAPLPPGAAAMFDDMDIPAPRSMQPMAPLPPPPNTGFELEIPEMTQIGAKPLIDDGAEAMVALVGERQVAPRVMRPSLPPPVAMSLPEAGMVSDGSGSKKTLLVIGGVAVAVIAIVIVVLVVFVL